MWLVSYARSLEQSDKSYVWIKIYTNQKGVEVYAVLYFTTLTELKTVGLTHCISVQ